MEEAQVLAQSALQSHDVDGFAVVVVDVLNHGAEIEVKQTPPNPGDDFGIGVGNAEDRLADAPSASNIPARKPPDHALVGEVGHVISSRIDWTRTCDPALIACMARLLPAAA